MVGTAEKGYLSVKLVAQARNVEEGLAAIATHRLGQQAVQRGHVARGIAAIGQVGRTVRQGKAGHSAFYSTVAPERRTTSPQRPTRMCSARTSPCATPQRWA